MAHKSLPPKPRDGVLPYVADFKFGGLSGRWRERLGFTCPACFAANAVCPHSLAFELPLRVLLAGHNPSEHAFVSGLQYSNPTNRMWPLLTGAFPAKGPHYPGLVPPDAPMTFQNEAPLVVGLGLSDLGVIPGNEANYPQPVLKAWRVGWYASMAGHMARVGATLAALQAAAEERGGGEGGGSGTGEASLPPPAKRRRTTRTAAAAPSQPPPTATSSAVVSSRFFTSAGAAAPAAAPPSFSSSSSGSSAGSIPAAAPAAPSSGPLARVPAPPPPPLPLLHPTLAAAAALRARILASCPGLASSILAALSALTGIPDLATSRAAAASAAACAPRIVAFTGKGQWKCLFEPPLQTCDTGLQPPHLRPPGWPFPPSTAVFVLTSSSGRAAMTDDVRAAPYRELAALAQGKAWLPPEVTGRLRAALLADSEAAAAAAARSAPAVN